VVLDVVLSVLDKKDPVTASRTSNSTDTSSDVVELQITQPTAHTSDDNNAVSNASTLQQQNAPPDTQHDTKTALSFKQVVKLVQKRTIESEVEQRLVATLPSDFQAKIRS
jgi:hypothetical protein